MQQYLNSFHVTRQIIVVILVYDLLNRFTVSRSMELLTDGVQKDTPTVDL